MIDSKWDGIKKQAEIKLSGKKFIIKFASFKAYFTFITTLENYINNELETKKMSALKFNIVFSIILFAFLNQLSINLLTGVML